MKAPPGAICPARRARPNRLPLVGGCLDGYAPPVGHMAPKPELPSPGPAFGSFGGRSFKALEFAWFPAWLPPGSSDTPGAGAMVDTPLSLLTLAACVTPSPTIGHRNSPLSPTPVSGGAAKAAACVATTAPTARTTTTKMRLICLLTFSPFLRASALPTSEAHRIVQFLRFQEHVLNCCETSPAVFSAPIGWVRPRRNWRTT